MNVWVPWLSSKVLEALKTPHTEPFAQNSQYKKAFKGEDENDDDAGAPGSKARTEKNKKKKRRKGPAQVKDVKVSTAGEGCEGEGYAPGDFAALKKNFVHELIQGGTSREEALNAWNLSDTKKKLLASLPLSELKRRKFVPKGAEVHPWAS